MASTLRKTTQPDRKNWNHADKDIGDDQPVSQPPEQLRAQPPVSGKREQNDGEHTEKNYPAPEARRGGWTRAPRQPLRHEQKQVEHEHVERRPRAPALRPEPFFAQLALEFQRDQSHPVA